MKGRPRRIRARLTLWYAGVLAAILVAYAVGVYLFLRQSLYAELDRQLGEDFEVAEELVEQGARGEVVAHGEAQKHHHDEESPAARWLELWSREGVLLYRESPGGGELPSPSAPALWGAVGPRTVALAPDVWLRVRSGAYPQSGTSVVIRVGRSGALVRELVLVGELGHSGAPGVHQRRSANPGVRVLVSAPRATALMSPSAGAARTI